jgi:hypothetical protein
VWRVLKFACSDRGKLAELLGKMRGEDFFLKAVDKGSGGDVYPPSIFSPGQPSCCLKLYIVLIV